MGNGLYVGGTRVGDSAVNITRLDNWSYVDMDFGTITFYGMVLYRYSYNAVSAYGPYEWITAHQCMIVCLWQDGQMWYNF